MTNLEGKFGLFCRPNSSRVIDLKWRLTFQIYLAFPAGRHSKQAGRPSTGGPSYYNLLKCPWVRRWGLKPRVCCSGSRLTKAQTWAAKAQTLVCKSFVFAFTWSGWVSCIGSITRGFSVIFIVGKQKQMWNISAKTAKGCCSQPRLTRSGAQLQTQITGTKEVEQRD